MRPIPRTRHLLAILLLAAASVTASYFSTIDNRLSKVQIHIATVAAKRHNPALFSQDSVFGDSVRWRFYTPALQALLEMILLPTDYQDLTLPFRMLTGVLTMVYLSGMYALLYRQCRSWSVSAYVAILSTTIIYALGRTFWGIGSLASITPATMLTSVTPLVVLSYLRYERQWRLLLIFGFVGLCANLHMVTAMNLATVLLIVYLCRNRFSPSCWPGAIGCALCAIMGAVPYVAYYLHLRYGLAPETAQIAAVEVYRAFRVGRLAVLYPDMLKSFFSWLLLVLVLLVPATAVLLRVERFRARDLSVWIALAGGAMIVALVFHGASQLTGLLTGKAPPVIDFAQAANLAMLPLYVLFAQALTNLFRLMRQHKVRLRWACLAFMAFWMLPSDNLRVARHKGYELAAYFMPEDQKPLRVQQRHAKRLHRAELAHIAEWAKDQTEIDSVFLIDSAEFRMLSNRSIVASSDDVKSFYYITPWELGSWRKRVAHQMQVLRPAGGKTSDLMVSKFIEELRLEYWSDAKHWYVILRASEAPEMTGSLQPIEGAGWGQHYRLYRAG